MGVSLSEKAASEVKRIIEEQKYPAETALRIGVAGGGCSGFQYSLGLDPAFSTSFDPKAENKYDCYGVTLIVDKKSALYLDGTTVDYFEGTINGLEKRGFDFKNPNAVKTCGCGSSFQA